MEIIGYEMCGYTENNSYCQAIRVHRTEESVSFAVKDCFFRTEAEVRHELKKEGWSQDEIDSFFFPENLW